MKTVRMETSPKVHTKRGLLEQCKNPYINIVSNLLISSSGSWKMDSHEELSKRHTVSDGENRNKIMKSFINGHSQSTASQSSHIKKKRSPVVILNHIKSRKLKDVTYRFLDELVASRMEFPYVILHRFDEVSKYKNISEYDFGIGEHRPDHKSSINCNKDVNIENIPAQLNWNSEYSQLNYMNISPIIILAKCGSKNGVNIYS